MPLTVFAPGQISVAGRVSVTIGAGFAVVAAPKLAELSQTITCSLVDGVTSTTEVKTKTLQLYCETSGKEVLDTRNRTLDTFSVYGDGQTAETAFLALVAEDAIIGMFIRPYTLSATALAVGDKGDALNFKVGKLDRGKAGIGDKWTYTVQPVEVTRSALNVALAA